MSNVIEQLAGLSPDTAAPVSDETVRRDVLRARAALRRRRIRRSVTSVGAVAAVAALTVGVVGARPAAGPPATGLDLVDYHGAQLPGFTVGKVPEGFVLQGADAFSLEIARPEDHSPLGDFSGKLVVMLQSKDAAAPPAGKTVTVDGHPATISTFDPAATQLYFSDGRHDLVVQAATELGLTDAELVEFAGSVTVTGQARASLG